MPVFLRAFPLKDDSASVSKPRRPTERLREVRWQEDQTLDRLLMAHRRAVALVAHDVLRCRTSEAIVRTADIPLA